MIAIVDYGIGNIRSLLKAFEKLGVAAEAAGSAAALARADRLVLPGVGQFGAAMAELRRRDLLGVLDERIRGAGVPVLGVCLGMQLLARHSEEGDAAGLGFIAAEVRRLRLDGAAAGLKVPNLKVPNLKVPNMGWRTLTVRQPDPLFPGPAPWRFYFAHSYHVVAADPAIVAATAEHGITFTAAVAAGNVFGVQFHPEKSHRFGFRLLAAFAGLQPPPAGGGAHG